MREITRQLVQITNSPDAYWKIGNLNGTELANLCVAFATLEVKSVKYIEAIITRLEHNYKKMSNQDLVNMANSSKYIAEFNTDIYREIHLTCVKRLKYFNEFEKSQLKNIYSSHAMIADSPVISAKLTRET